MVIWFTVNKSNSYVYHVSSVELFTIIAHMAYKHVELSRDVQKHQLLHGPDHQGPFSSINPSTWPVYKPETPIVQSITFYGCEITQPAVARSGAWVNCSLETTDTVLGLDEIAE